MAIMVKTEADTKARQATLDANPEHLHSVITLVDGSEHVQNLKRRSGSGDTRAVSGVGH